MVLGFFKKKKKKELPPEMVIPEKSPIIPELLEPSKSTMEKPEVKPISELPTETTPETLFPDLSPLPEEGELVSPTSKNAALESLCIKIDLEAEDIERKIKDIKNIVDKLNINSPEIFDLLKLHTRTKNKLNDFIEEVDRFDTAGWGINEDRAAFYKFRACKSLAKIRKEMNDIEKIIKQSGFTPSKIDEILKTPAKQLVEQLAKITPETKKKK